MTIQCDVCLISETQNMISGCRGEVDVLSCIAYVPAALNELSYLHLSAGNSGALSRRIPDLRYDEANAQRKQGNLINTPRVSTL